MPPLSPHLEKHVLSFSPPASVWSPRTRRRRIIKSPPCLHPPPRPKGRMETLWGIPRAPGSRHEDAVTSQHSLRESAGMGSEWPVVRAKGGTSSPYPGGGRGIGGAHRVSARVLLREGAAPARCPAGYRPPLRHPTPPRPRPRPASVRRGAPRAQQGRGAAPPRVGRGPLGPGRRGWDLAT